MLALAVMPLAGAAVPGHSLFTVFAGNIAVSVSQDSATVGDVITFDIRLNVPKDARIIPPETEKGFGDFVVLSWDIDSAGVSCSRPPCDDGGIVYRYSIATYKPQNCTIPSLTFLTGGENDTVYDTLTTQSIPIRVISVIPAGTPDSALAIRDLKAQQKTGGADIRSLWILLIVALLVAAYILWERYAKKKAGADAPAAVPLKPPYDEAMELIAALEAKRYLERGESREYVFELSEIFKRYIGRRYNTIAPELTTEEIVAWLEFSGISREMRMCVEWFCRTSDQVKFAKWKPDSQTLDRFMKEVRLFLEATKPDTELPYEQMTQRMGVVE